MTDLVEPDMALDAEEVVIDLVRRPGAFAAMRAEWDELLGHSNAGIFNSWEWLNPWYRHLGQHYSLRILTARLGNGILVGVMPLCLQRQWIAGHRVRRIAFLGETHVGSDYLDVIARHGFAERVTRSFAEVLHSSSGTWDVLDLLGLDSASPTVNVLRETFRGGDYRVVTSAAAVCPYQPFQPGETFEQLLLRTKRRANYRRRKKWLDKQPGYCVTCSTEYASVLQAFDELLRLHALRWEQEGGSEVLSNPRVLAFHRDAGRLLAESGRLRVYTMEVEGKAVASVYGIVHNNTFHYYQSGRDPEWQAKSVGLVLIGETFKDSIESGLCAYDFLQGDELFKSDWASEKKHTVGIRIYRAHGVGCWLERRDRSVKLVRDYAKRMLPEPWVHRISHWTSKC